MSARRTYFIVVATVMLAGFSLSGAALEEDTGLKSNNALHFKDTTTVQYCGCRSVQDDAGVWRTYVCGCRVYESSVADALLLGTAMFGLGAMSLKKK